tara:strand:- start:14512 stop:15561 length:1050 start_codon:yes stop_codon:yes gene_type:complete
MTSWDYDGALDYLRKGRDPYGKGRPMGKATRLQYRGQVENGYECIALRYWQTDVVRWYRSIANKSNKWYSIDAQYDSRTTNDRIQAYTGLWTSPCKATGKRVIQQWRWDYDTCEQTGSKSNWREVVVEGSEIPLIADHQTWFRKDGHVRHLKRCQDRYRREMGEYNVRKNNRRIDYEEKLLKARQANLKILREWSNSKLVRALDGMKSKSLVQVQREMETLHFRTQRAKAEAERREVHFAELEDKIIVGKRLKKMEQEMKARAEVLKVAETYPEIRKAMHKLNLQLDNLRGKVDLAEDTYRMQKVRDNLSLENIRLLKEKEALEKEVGYLLAKKEGAQADEHSSVLNRL